MAPSVSNAGITTDEASGERHIPASTRADGSTRKAIRVRPGYRPPEDVELYRARNAVARRERNRQAGVPGASTIPPPTNNRSTPREEAAAKTTTVQPATPPRVIRRTEITKQDSAEKDTKATVKDHAKQNLASKGDTKHPTPDVSKDPVVDLQVEREKKARNLKKKLKQAKELQTKKENGEGLLPEQIAKVIKINELVRELSLLGFGESDIATQKDKDISKPEAK